MDFRLRVATAVRATVKALYRDRKMLQQHEETKLSENRKWGRKGVVSVTTLSKL